MHVEDRLVDLVALIAESRRFVAKRADAKSQTIQTDAKTPSITLRADERYLRQVLINLLDNAIKYSPDGGDIRVRAERLSDGRTEVSISDNGIGIAATDIPEVLRPFGKLQGDAQRTNDGIGLGLPLSKKLTELHGGELTIESMVDQGTTVRVILPAERSVEGS